MAEYIEREAAVKCLCEGYDGFSAMTPSYYNGFMNAVYHVKNTIPAADVAPVRRGRWIDRMVRDWRCSECSEKLLGRGYDGYVYKDLPNYCPNCGADMRGE